MGEFPGGSVVSSVVTTFFTAKSAGSIPGQGTKFQKPSSMLLTPQKKKCSFLII